MDTTRLPAYDSRYGPGMGPSPGYHPPPPPPAAVGIPQGTGLEGGGLPRGIDSAAELQAAFQRLWNRIAGDYATRSVCMFQLARVVRTNPDLVQPRPLIVTARVPAPVAGTQPMNWRFPTIGAINAIRAFLDPAGGGTLNDARLVIAAGSQGGFVLGTDQNPASLSALGTVNGDCQPVAMAAAPVNKDNDWTGTLTVDAAGAGTTVEVTLYGVALWGPQGQLR